MTNKNNNKKLKLPVAKGKKDHFPNKPLCPICKKNKVFEPHSMAILSGGALLLDRKNKSGGPSNKLDAYFSLIWHGAHDKGKGKYKEIGCIVDIAQDIHGGQFDLYFCSTACLRKFLNLCIDKLEKK